MICVLSAWILIDGIVIDNDLVDDFFYVFMIVVIGVVFDRSHSHVLHGLV